MFFIDPAGAAVELFQTTEEERQCSLNELKKALGNEEAASRLYIDEVQDGDKIRYFVGIKGDIGDFMEISDTAHDLANLVKDRQVVEFGITTMDLSEWGGGATFEKGRIGNDNVRALVNPNQLHIAAQRTNPDTPIGSRLWEGQDVNVGSPYLKKLNYSLRWQVRPFTVGIVIWHELGHSWGFIHGRINEQSYREAINWENKMRQQVYGQLGPRNAPRRADK